MCFKRLLISAQIFSVGLFGGAAQELSQPPKTLAKWDLICFCSARFFTPQPIVELGNNGEILYQARSGITRAQLKSNGVLFSEQQLRILEACSLLEADGPLLRTSFPVIGPTDMEILRSELQKQAQSNGKALKAKVQPLVEELSRQGYSENAYSVVFSYLLDGLVWNDFEKHDLMPKNEITPDKPFWNGTFFAVYPVRTGRPGTNTTHDHGWSIALIWTDPILKTSTSQEFLHQFNGLLAEMASKGSLKDPALIKRMQPYGLTNTNGQLTIPVIHEKSGDPVYTAALAISQEIAKEMIAIVHTPKFTHLLKTSDHAKALVIGYHEYMWELLSYLETEGIISKPTALRDGEQVKASDLHSLVFMVETTP